MIFEMEILLKNWHADQATSRVEGMINQEPVKGPIFFCDPEDLYKEVLEFFSVIFDVEILLKIWHSDQVTSRVEGNINQEPVKGPIFKGVFFFFDHQRSLAG